MPPRDVVAVGSAVIDHLYTLSNLPEADGGAFVRDHTTDVGGVAANVAAGLAEFGTETGLISRVGADTAAEITDDLRARGIDCARLQSGPEESSYTMILRGPDGRRMIIAGGQSVPSLRLGEQDITYASEAEVVFTSAYAPDAVVSTLVEARERGDISTLVFDLAGPLPELEGRGTTEATIDRLLSVVDLFVVGEVAATSYFGGAVEDVVDTLAHQGVPRAAVTHGADGAFLLEAGAVTRVPAFDIEIEDTTGAGDSFTAGLIHTWLLGSASVRDAGRFAAAAAALTCTTKNARGHLPTEADIRAFLEDH